MTTTTTHGRTLMTVLALLCGVLAATLAALTPHPGAHAEGPAAETDYSRMILVLDSSGSMAEPAGSTTKIEAAKQALGTVVEGLPDEAYVGLRVYGATVFSREDKGACTDSQLVVGPGTDNRAELAAALETYEPYGETPIAHALREAARDIGGESSRSIVLVSDGIATCDPDPCVVAGELAEQGIDLQINVVGLAVDADARAQLRCIAAKGNGTYYDADDADDIVESLDLAAMRSLRQFALEGVPVEGGTESAPTPVQPGLWSDAIGTTDEEAERWFSYTRTMPGSTVRFGLTSLGGKKGTWDTALISASTAEGDGCGSDSGFKNINAGELLGVELLVGGSQGSEACAEAETVLVSVSRSLRGLGEAEAPFVLQVVEEPPVDADSPGSTESAPDQPFRAPKVTAATTEVAPGSSFGTAPEITDGVYEGAIVPGETQAFRIPVGYGQTLSARVRTPAASPSLYKHTGALGPYASLQLFSPMRGDAVARGEGIDPTGFAAASEPQVLTAQTPQVRYSNRDSSMLLGASLSGDYYVVLAADADADDEGYEMPYTLEVQVHDEEAGAPTYSEGEVLGLGGVEEVVAAAQDADSEAESEPAATEEKSPTGQDEAQGPGALTWLAAAGLGLVAVGCLVAAVVLVRRSRT